MILVCVYEGGVVGVSICTHTATYIHTFWYMFFTFLYRVRAEVDFFTGSLGSAECGF